MTNQPPHRQAGDGLLMRRLESAQKDCMDQGQAAAILLQDARAEVMRLTLLNRTPSRDRLCDDYLASSSLKAVQITDAMLDAHMMATGDWVSPFVWKHDPDIEDANQVPEGLTQAGADRINAGTREQLRKGYIAAFSRQPPHSSSEG